MFFISGKGGGTGVRFRVYGVRIRVYVLGCKVCGIRCMVQR